VRQWPPSGRPESAPREKELESAERKQFRLDERTEKKLRRWSRWHLRWRRLLSPASRLFAIVAALELVALALEAKKVPSDTFWQHRGAHLTVTAISVVALALTAVLAEAYRDVVARRRGDQRLRDVCRSIARAVQTQTGLAGDDISVHLWAVRRPRRWFVANLRLHRLEFLERRAAHVPERREHEDFAFIKGRGVIGRCWLRRREVVVDLQALQAQAPTAEAYYKLGYEGRFRMTFAQLWNTRQFMAVWAYPLFVGPAGSPEFGGCLSVDLSCRDEAQSLERLADNRTPELSSLLADCAGILREEF
jgi:hypothetical protein